MTDTEVNGSCSGKCLLEKGRKDGPYTSAAQANDLDLGLIGSSWLELEEDGGLP